MRLTYKAFALTNAKLRQQSLLRKLPKEKNFLYDFSHNDYLGLSSHPALLAAAQSFQGALVGARASRLITLQQKQIQSLEKQIAHNKQCQSALIFNSGFQANVSILSCLLDKKLHGKLPLVFSDKLNHASMHMGCQIAQVKQIRYPHLNVEHLRFLLQKYPRDYPKFILTESVFGMDGDVAPLGEFIKLAKDFNALLYVDEAHATGLFGENGYGCAADFNGEIDIVMGTFSKALGSSGAYVACPQIIKRYLLNRCVGLIYSTAPSLVNIALMQTAWDLIPSLQAQVKSLLRSADQLRAQFKTMGLNTGTSMTHIIPIILNDAKLTLTAQRILNEHDIHVSAIRPPSVGPNQSRLRIALSVIHDEKAKNALINAMTGINYSSDRKYNLDPSDFADSI